MKKIFQYMLIALMPVLSVAHAQNTGAYLTDGSVSVVKSGFGLCWRTGSWTPATANKECDPELFKEDTTPKKVEEAVKVKVEEEKKIIPVVKVKQPITIVLKEYFDFDKAELSQANKEKLSEVVAKIKTFNVEVITVSGYADRIGTEDYNQSLSEKRANVVKEELSRLGVDKSKIYTESKGENYPEVNCPGKTTAKVIACLAPNRRVKIEVVGAEK